MCLTEVACQIVGGLVFVHLGADPESPERCYPGLATGLAEHLPGLERLRPVARHEVVERCNWKVSVENYSECYHCRRNHPTFASGVIAAAGYTIRAEGHCLRHRSRAIYPGNLLNAYRWEALDHRTTRVTREWFATGEAEAATARRRGRAPGRVGAARAWKRSASITAAARCTSW